MKTQAWKMTVLGMAVCWWATAASGGEPSGPGTKDSEAWQSAPAASIARWRAMRFGLFVHWGPVSLTGKEIGWSRAGERRGHRTGHGTQTPVEIYELQIQQGDTWHTVFAGKTIGADFRRSFPAVTARHVRLNILEATEGPTIWEFRLFAPTD